MAEHVDPEKWNYEDLVSGGSGNGPPDYEEPPDPNKSNNLGSKDFLKPLVILNCMLITGILGADIVSHYFLMQPVMPLGNDSYLSEMGFFGGMFEGGGESVTVSDFFALTLAVFNVILAKIFYHYMLNTEVLDEPEHFMAKRSQRVKVYLVIFFYIVTICTEAMALYWRMGLNEEALRQKGNPLSELVIHGTGELIGYSLAVICLNAGCAFVATLLTKSIMNQTKGD